MWLLLNVLYYREVAYEILCDYFFTFYLGEGLLLSTPKTPFLLRPSVVHSLFAVRI